MQMSEIINVAIEEAVARGAGWLDRIVPAWENYVNPDSLDIASWSHCVLGQLCQLNHLQPETLPSPPEPPGESELDRFRHNGFLCIDRSAQKLNSKWREAICERRSNTSRRTEEAPTSELAASLESPSAVTS